MTAVISKFYGCTSFTTLANAKDRLWRNHAACCCLRIIAELNLVKKIIVKLPRYYKPSKQNYLAGFIAVFNRSVQALGTIYHEYLPPSRFLDFIDNILTITRSISDSVCLQNDSLHWRLKKRTYLDINKTQIVIQQLSYKTAYSVRQPEIDGQTISHETYCF